MKNIIQIAFFVFLLISGCGSAVSAQRRASKPLNTVWKYKYLMNGDGNLVATSKDTAILAYVPQTQDVTQDIEIYTLTAIDLKTGKVRWQTKSYGEPKVQIDENTVYVKSDVVKAFDVRNGNLKWTFDPKSYIDASIDEVKSKDGVVYVLGEEFGLFALDGETGERKWNFRPCFNYANNNYYDEQSSKIVFAETTIVLTCANYQVHGVSASDGKPLRDKLYYDVQIKDIFTDNKSMYVLGEFYQGNGFVQALNVENFQTNWTSFYEANNFYDAELYLDANGIHLNSNFGSFKSLDKNAGSVDWQTEIGSQNIEIESADGYKQSVSTKTLSLFSDDSTIYGSTESGVLRAIDSASGKVKWEKQLSKSPLKKGHLINKTIIVNSSDSLFAVNAFNGELLWEIKTDITDEIRTDESGNIFLVISNRLFGVTSLDKLNAFVKNGGKRIADVKTLTYAIGRGSGGGNGIGGAVGVKEFEISETALSSNKAYFVYTKVLQGKAALYEINLTDGSKKMIAEMGASGTLTPVINDKIAFVATKQTLYGRNQSSKSGDGKTPSKLYAVDLVNNKVLWDFDANGFINTAPVSDGKNVYFYSDDGIVHALDNDGKPLWETSIITAEKKSLKTSSAKFIYENSGFESTNAAPESNGLINSDVKLVYESNRLYINTPKNQLSGIDAANGKIMWSVKSAIEFNNLIALGKCVYVGEKNVLKCFDSQTGELMRETKFSSDINKITKQLDSLIVNARAGYALVDQNGKILWHRETEPKSLLLAENEFLQPNYDVVLNFKTGEKLRRLGNLKGFENGNFIYQNQDVLYLKDDESLSALNYKAAKVLWMTAFKP